MQDSDLEASGRLRAEVYGAFGRTAGVPANENQLHKATGIARTTLEGYLEKGIQPSVDNMRKIAKAIRVPTESLWLRWLGYEAPEPGLTRIADEISDLRDALLRQAARRVEGVEQQDWEQGRDRGQEADDEPDGEPGTRPA